VRQHLHPHDDATAEEAEGDDVMKATVLAAMAAGLLLTAAPAGASSFLFNDNDIKYYWEVDPPGRGMASYGWDYQPRPWKISGPVIRKPGETMYSFCARQVGRLMRTDDSGLGRSVMMTDGCVRRGGRL
jgi:hypothetical protein